jgi:hypothetical protein
LLGDLPILGALFRSRSVRARKTELLVLVTPHLVDALDQPPPVPTGEIENCRPVAWASARSLPAYADRAGSGALSRC